MVMNTHIPLNFLTHSKRVCQLYKKALRQVQSHYVGRHHYRFHACLMRARFDESKDVKDPRQARELLFAGEQELFEKQHPIPIVFAGSPLGCAYNRDPVAPDWLLDYWHPLEKAQYPDYFARREQRKKDYTAWWDKNYGNWKPKDSSH